MSQALAITGVGLVTPLGVTAAETFHAWRQGAEAVFIPVPEWTETPLASRRAVVPPPFDADGRLGPRGRKLRKFMSPAALLACLASREAVARAAPLDRWPPERLGLFSLVGLADTETEDARALVDASLDDDGRVSCRLLGERGLARANPLLSFRTLPNMPGCLVSILERIEGENALYTTSIPEDGILWRAAVDAFGRGTIDGALLCAVDMGAAPAVGAHFARLDAERQSESHLPAATAAVAVFVERAAPERRGVVIPME